MYFARILEYVLKDTKIIYFLIVYPKGKMYDEVVLLIIWTKEVANLKIDKEARKFKIQGKTRL